MVIIKLILSFERGIELIVGIGTDIVEIDRIEKLINGKEDFKLRVFTQREIEYSNKNIKKSTQHFAVRFAAKEAVLKALGIGFREVKWQDIEITNDELGKPEVILTGNAKRIALQKKIENWHVSLSHSDENAIAFVIAEK